MTTAAELKDAFMQLLPATFQYVTSHGGQPLGPPFGRYHHFEPEKVDLEAGIVVKTPMAAGMGVSPGEIPGGLYASVEHVGPYEQLMNAWQAIGDYISANNLQIIGAPLELYWTDPGEEPDPSKWRTEIVYPISG